MWDEPSLATLVLEQRIGRKVAVEYANEMFADCPLCWKKPEWGHTEGCLLKRWIDAQTEQGKPDDNDNADTYETEIGDLNVTVTIEQRSEADNEQDEDHSDPNLPF